ncbi:23S rRNA (adenine(1618)-N(6))-methyltransferase RlmF [Vibrio algarum]|uniref:Ribosomal RNA large subunit methyltransferase F n=1 Tax=Vibrio algarum TaxID=3020714 RepID=A0ABT4YXJ7_9VIBR|nr:23S rRNA (adenine(1618)-N(6))-methyltransferase RlmF [Vibrio sp. KJ40-1]MDB1126190.1 23S rRNA (adenine(1618)-N(6))-methyltransferase RlmF [Vibrio sp. KJ40-1]
MNKIKNTSFKKRSIDTKTAIQVKIVSSPAGLHPKNKHHGRYNFEHLVKALPELERVITNNPRGEHSIDFSNPLAVKLLNKALLCRYYDVKTWDIPEGYLCPPIPGRADYIHRVADLLRNESKGLKHHLVRVLDIGVGANCIYPIIGVVDYKWSVVASDIDPVSIHSAKEIVTNNLPLKGKIECRLQTDSKNFFQNIILPGEYYDITTCNPPFHKSLSDAQQGTDRKIKNLALNRQKRGKSANIVAEKTQPALNFGGQKAELWCTGGEAEFVKNMVLESREFADQVLWFSTLISKKENVRWMKKNLEKVNAIDVQILEMSQGQKVSRIVAWTFKTHQQRQQWLKLKS